MTSLDALTLAQIRVDNNKLGTIAKINEQGYQLKYDVSSQVVMELLTKIYETDKQSFFAIITSVPYSVDANNYTNTASFINAVKSYYDKFVSQGSTERIDFGGMLSNIGSFLSGSTTTTTSTTSTQTTPVKKSNVGLIIGLSILGVAVVVFGIFMLKK